MAARPHQLPTALFIRGRSQRFRSTGKLACRPPNRPAKAAFGFRNGSGRRGAAGLGPGNGHYAILGHPGGIGGGPDARRQAAESRVWRIRPPLTGSSLPSRRDWVRI